MRPTLSFDGCGINGPDEYRRRLFTAGLTPYDPVKPHACVYFNHG